MEKLRMIAEAHGFATESDPAGVVVLVPWTNVQTGEEGIDRELVTTAGDLAEALGY